MLKKAYFGAGCFWGVQKTFDFTLGVVKTTVGYSGGHVINPTYNDVCTGKTMHAKTIEIIYDSKKTTYKELLKIFFLAHDSTQLNKQGPDIGSQYRSIIFFVNEEQKKIAIDFIELEQKKNSKKIVTTIEKIKNFFLAEDYHQKHYKKDLGVC
jgi:methionine-S-sulfoxide reductase